MKKRPASAAMGKTKFRRQVQPPESPVFITGVSKTIFGDLTGDSFGER
jgi:hypothetical protein